MSPPLSAWTHLHCHVCASGVRAVEGQRLTAHDVLRFMKIHRPHRPTMSNHILETETIK